jgi:hypothetical protein
VQRSTASTLLNVTPVRAGRLSWEAERRLSAALCKRQTLQQMLGSRQRAHRCVVGTTGLRFRHIQSQLPARNCRASGPLLSMQRGLPRVLSMQSCIVHCNIESYTGTNVICKEWYTQGTGSAHSQSAPTARSSLRGPDRPLAGTLIVAPTSLLTQWESELNTKVRLRYMELVFALPRHAL